MTGRGRETRKCHYITRPAAKCNCLLQRRASASSWVTRISVVPCARFSSSISSMIWLPVAASRLPVGSSANNIFGLNNKRARNRHALLFAAGKVFGQVRHTRSKANALPGLPWRVRAHRARRAVPAAASRFPARSTRAITETTETRNPPSVRAGAHGHLHRRRKYPCRRDTPCRCWAHPARPAGPAGWTCRSRTRRYREAFTRFHSEIDLVQDDQRLRLSIH